MRRLSQVVIHDVDVRGHAMVLTERYKKSSTEWESFRTLYGVTPDNMINSLWHTNSRTLFIANTF